MTFEMLMGVYVFVLACFAGYPLIAKVPPTLHTPLMSGSNAIAGITVLAAMQVSAATSGVGPTAANIIGCLATACATINVVGGFWVTERMLMMFKRKE